MSKLIDLADQTFDRLTVIKRAKNDRWGQACWRCECICGNTVTATGNDLRSKNTKSCGCLNRELAAKRLFVHGMSKSHEYYSWAHMTGRCHNPTDKDFKHYGGRGITVCDKWRNSFVDFFNDVGKRPSPELTIERINNNHGYNPNNVRWANRHAQANNKRNNYKITLHSHTMTLAMWAKFTGINNQIVWNRINMLYWPPSKAIFTPVRHR